MKNLLFLGFLVLTIASCKTKQTANKVTTTETRAERRGQIKEICEALSLDKSIYNDSALIRPTISDIYIKENCISLIYSYSGCGVQKPTLVWDKVINDEGTFPKVNLRFLMKNPGMCEAFYKDSAAVSIDQLRSVGNQVLLIINDKKTNLPLLDFQN